MAFGGFVPSTSSVVEVEARTMMRKCDIGKDDGIVDGVGCSSTVLSEGGDELKGDRGGWVVDP